jgi:hypothetical protein
MPIQVLRKGHRGRAKQDWIGIPGGITPVAASAAAGGTVVLSTAPAVGTISGTWVYSSTDTRFTFSGSTMSLYAGLAAGVYDVPIVARNGANYVKQTVIITVV